MAKQSRLNAGDLRLCIDRIIPADLKRHAADLAIKESSRNDPLQTFAKLRPAGVSLHPAKMALLTGKLWANGKVLGVRFLDGSNTQRQRVIKHAEEWLSYANVRFNWKAGKKAELRVSFGFDSGSWSAVGTDCLHTEYFKKNEPTINFGWLRDDTDDTEYTRVVVHEFGHALGCIHEHQNPRGGITWNEEAVYAAFSGPPNNWSRDEIYSNVMMKYSLDQLNATKFDRRSIMLYSFPKAFIKAPASLAKTGTASNTDLSAGDKKFIAKNYPK